MSLSAIITAVVGAIGAIILGYFRYRQNRQSERDQNLGRLQQRDRQHDRDLDALGKSKEIDDEVEALDNRQLRDALGRFVRK